MPFGAQLGTQGVEFRLWAPSASRVDLLLEDAAQPQVRPMSECGQGWFARTEPDARAGTRYRFRIDAAFDVPDPASRWNDTDAEGPSVVMDPAAFDWGEEPWTGRPWHEAVIYELHIGAFTPEGSFRATTEKLDHLQSLGVTMLELMPIGDFPGQRGWGYDGVLPFAPDSAYGTPDELKALIRAAHARGLGVVLDVVYNHFGPQGNFLARFAPQFSTPKHSTPWGEAMNFDQGGSATVREFFVHNALYWIEEFQFDGLRLDAVHAIHDQSQVHILTAIARAVRAGPGRTRRVHLIAENHANDAATLGYPRDWDRFDAQWNDDVHHCLHVILSGESAGYYADFARQPQAQLARGLAEGFVFQGEHSEHDGRARGSPSDHLPPTAFVNFLQNHDQIGNRPLGERLIAIAAGEQALRAAVSILLLAPAVPLLFMGEEWGSTVPFPYFCDFNGELAEQVRQGRREEFAGFAKLSGDRGESLPDPTAPDTFESSRLDWSRLHDPEATRWLEFYRRLLGIRRTEIMPLIPEIRSARYAFAGPGTATRVAWSLSDGSNLVLLYNLSAEQTSNPQRSEGRLLYTSAPSAAAQQHLDPWSVIWLHGRRVPERDTGVPVDAAPAR
jgi:malto-oligosyltrehalose trehalohydrolase